MVSRTPPHLAQPVLTYATHDESEPYYRAVSRGFHGDYLPDHWTAERNVVEWDRTFGFQVDGRWVSTCAAFSRAMTVPGGQVPVAAVSLVTVAPPYRRRRLLTEMMKHQLDDVRQRGKEPVALLWASESSIYGRFGYGHAVPRSAISGPTLSAAFLPSVDLGGGSVDEVESEEYLTAATAVHHELLAERPGGLDRSSAWWAVQLFDPESRRQGASALRFALHFGESGQPDGYAAFRVADSTDPTLPGREVRISDLDARNASAYAGLWRFLLNLDLVHRFTRTIAPADEPLRYLVADQRLVKTETSDSTYARLVDVPAALQSRSYVAESDTVVEVHDPLLTENNGLWRLQLGPSGAQVNRASARPDVTVGIRELGACYLGGTSLVALHRAGLVNEHASGAVNALAASMSWPTPPFCPDEF